MVSWEGRKGLFSVNFFRHVVKVEIESGHGLFQIEGHEKNNPTPKFTATVSWSVLNMFCKVHHGCEK